MNLRTWLLLIFAVTLVNQTRVLPVSAQSPNVDQKQPFDLSISPPSSYLVIHPGNLAIHVITLKNDGLEALEVTPQLVDFSTDGTTGQPVLSTTHTFPYLDLDKTSFETITLPPGSTAQLRLHFTIPSDAPDHEYPLTLLFKANKPGFDTAAGTPVAGIIGSNIIVLVSKTNELPQTLSIEDFQSPWLIDSFSEVSFAPIIKNNTFAATVASGSASITDWRGKKVAQFELNPKVILGYSSRQIEPMSDQETSPNPVTSEGQFRTFIYDEPLLLGPYTITISFNSPDPSLSASSEYTMIVWAVPFALIIALLAIVSVYGYTTWKKRHYNYF